MALPGITDVADAAAGTVKGIPGRTRFVAIDSTDEEVLEGARPADPGRRGELARAEDDPER